MSSYLRNEPSALGLPLRRSALDDQTEDLTDVHVRVYRSENWGGGFRA